MSETAAAALSPAEPAGEVDNSTTTDTTSSAPEWTKGLSEDSIAFAKQRGWENPHQLFESYRNLEKLQTGSKDIVALPGVDADEDTMNQFYDRLGRPSDPSQYGFETPENADPELMEWFGNTAHRYGLSEKQAKGLFNEWNEMTGAKMENLEHEMKVQGENDINNLKKEWGADYDKMVNAGRLAANGLGYGEEQLSALEEKMGTGEMLKLFATLGSKMGEDSFATGNESGSGFGTSPAQAKAQMDELRTDSQFMDAYMSGDKAAVAKMQKLMEIAHG